MQGRNQVTLQTYIVDVFASEPLSGNPLAVVLGEAFPEEQRMQKIAAEMNFSETVFAIFAEQRGKYPIRIFTPAQEIQFAGHPIIGTAAVLRQFHDAAVTHSMMLDTRIGPLEVDFEKDGKDVEMIWMQSPVSQFGQTLPHELVCGSVGLRVADLDSSLPVQVISAGTAALLVPVRTADALYRAHLDLEQHLSLARKGVPKLIYLFCRETRQAENDFQARFFFDANGAREDPATGNGAAFFGAYLLRYLPACMSRFPVRIEQGYSLGRPSLIHVRTARGNDSRIQVGGSVYPVLQGKMLVS